MAEIIDIYPTSNYTYFVNLPFSVARNTGSSQEIGTYSYLESSTYSVGGGQWKIYRSYIQFDLSGVPGDIVQLDFNAAKLYNGDSAAILVYGGSGSLVGDVNEYSLYLDNLVYDGGSNPIPLFEVYDPPSFFPDYYSVILDTTNYPVNPPYTNFIVGLVTKGDFNELEEARLNPTLQGSSSLYPPYLRVHYFPTGYTNAVMGVIGANISTVSGVPSANISKVMGV